MVDALASGASVCMDVEVRVLSWAPPASDSLIYIVFLGVLWEVSYQISPKLRTKLVY